MPLPRPILCLIPFGWDDEDPIFKKIGLFDHKGLQRLAERARIDLKKERRLTNSAIAELSSFQREELMSTL